MLGMSKRDRSADGFTLIEVMIAVAIVAIGAALAAPEFARWHAQTQLRQATSEVVSQLTLARMAAMNRNRGVDVTIQATSGVVTVGATASGSSAEVIPSTSLMRSVRGVAGGPVTVSFSSLGTRSSAGTGTQSFGLCNVSGVQYSVLVALSGRVSWQAASTATPCP